MTPSRSETAGAQGPRRKVKLPDEMVDRFRRKCRERGHIGSTLIYGWLMDAVRAAREGRYEFVPPRSSAPPATGDQAGVLWSQDPREASRWSRELQDAGSTTRAIIAARVQAYLDSDGDPLAVPAPRERPELAAAG